MSGLTAFNTPAQKGDVAAQAENILNQIKSILEAENTGFENLLKVAIFVTEFEGVGKLRKVLFDFYAETLPASSLIQVESLFAPELKVEIEAVVAFS